MLSASKWLEVSMLTGYVGIWYLVHKLDSITETFGDILSTARGPGTSSFSLGKRAEFLESRV